MCCTARRSLEEKVLNTEVDAEVPQKFNGTLKMLQEEVQQAAQA